MPSLFLDLNTLIADYVDSLTRMDAERDLQKTLAAQAAAEHRLEPVAFKKVATAIHKAQTTALRAERDAQLALLAIVTPDEVTPDEVTPPGRERVTLAEAL